MVALAIMIEGQNGLNWPLWQQLVSEVENLGFAGLFRSDHFTNARPPDKDALEMIVSLTYLADHTQRIHFGPLVAPFTTRNPMQLVRQAAALDDLSIGRMILGLGAGWQEREHHLFGFELGDIPTRMSRFEEGLEVTTLLLKSAEPVSYQGHFYQLREATLLPRPQHPGGLRILIGGNGPKRTLPLAARYADIWNSIMISPAEFRERSAQLDKLVLDAGREPTAVKRTMMRGINFGRDKAELDKRLRWRANNPQLANLSLDAAIDALVQQHEIVGTPDMIVEQIQSYAAAGVEELMLQWLDIDDIDGLRAFAKSVLHRL